MKAHISRMTSKLSHTSPKWLWWAGGVLVVLIALLSLPGWFPILTSLAHGLVEKPTAESAADEPHEEHAGHDHAEHDHAGHEEAQSIELSPQARKNIGLNVGEVHLTSYARSITVPAIVTERPGKTHQKIAAPLTGVVTGVHVLGDETVQSGDLLFNLRLTHEDLVQAQTEFLANLGKLDVEQRELARLEKIKSGFVADKVLIERQYEIDKLEAILKAQRNSLHLHGLTDEQIDHIAESRNLIREMKVVVPYLHADSSVHSDNEAPHGPKTNPRAEGDADHPLRSQRFVVSQLNVQPGEAVQTGQTLCVLTDYSELYIEGRAFEQDADEIVQADNAGRQVTAFPEQPGSGSPSGLENLEIVHVSNQVERDSRALYFYVNLENEIVREKQRGEHKFVTWRFKPGQRMQLRVPVEQWEKSLVVPVDAIAQEGPEQYVFVENGRHFDRRSVHVLYRDQYEAVIANDGSIFPGETLAMNGAHQLQMALKKKVGGGGGDPHAGHMH